MSLYTYVPGKAELLDLMLDTVYGQMSRGDLSGKPCASASQPLRKRTGNCSTIIPGSPRSPSAGPRSGPDSWPSTSTSWERSEASARRRRDGRGSDLLARLRSRRRALGVRGSHHPPGQCAQRGIVVGRQRRLLTRVFDQGYVPPPPSVSAPARAPPTAPTTPTTSAYRASSTASAPSSMSTAPDRTCCCKVAKPRAPPIGELKTGSNSSGCCSWPSRLGRARARTTTRSSSANSREEHVCRPGDQCGVSGRRPGRRCTPV
jgi:hypothetical protein